MPSPTLFPLASRNPAAVIMTRGQALELAAAIQRAQTRIVAQVDRLGRAHTPPDPEKVKAVVALRADLETLTTFLRAHEEAHGIGATP